MSGDDLRLVVIEVIETINRRLEDPRPRVSPLFLEALKVRLQEALGEER